MTGTAPSPPVLRLEFCGEWFTIPFEGSFVVGRDADLVIDENPFLHRRFLEVACRDGFWWLANVGAGLSATISDDNGRVQAWLAPGAHLPIVFETTVVRFSAGPTSYEFTLHLPDPPFAAPPGEKGGEGTTTRRIVLTEEQKLIIVALAEPALKADGMRPRSLPSSAEAAERLGWPLTKFNRKLDNVCQKLEKAGVRGLHGDPDRLASGRRGRLVEYALASRLIEKDDLQLLDSGERVPHRQAD
jgi:hypothetical protein